MVATVRNSLWNTLSLRGYRYLFADDVKGTVKAVPFFASFLSALLEVPSQMVKSFIHA